ncbi:methyl-viologen-reducing hydrogenase subunit delta [candidate division KSB1 bacterium]|nr:MAG: methyl-viologen-reducing hydrogenase subunit delta [candidate division KSB1 bacterium]
MEENFEPRLVGFMCRWCTYQAADLAGTSRMKYPSNLIPIKVLCSSRVDPLWVLIAFMRGADGVLVAGCHPGDCHYQEGNYHTRRRFVLVKNVFDSLGLESERLRLSWISASEGRKFVEVTSEFIKNIKEKGPNPAKKAIFL